MHRCLELAALGSGQVSPNPMVGSVIVVDDKIIAEGYHARAGQAHAEVHAITKVRDISSLRQAILYVNLEPCTHLGKTPPCVDAIVAARIPKVVVGMIDPSDKVSGRGITALKENGVEVVVGVLEAQSRELNRRFVTYHSKKRPHVILKWAQTADGFLARGDGSSKWISGQESRKLVHQWRSEEDAILVGTKTAFVDNPQLTVRHIKGRSPIRLVIDQSLRVPSSYNIYDDKAQTIIFTSKASKISEQTEHVALDFSNDVVGQILQTLYQRNIISVIIEGGAKTLASFIDQGLWDEARVFTSNQAFGSGIRAPTLDEHLMSEEKIGDDILRTLRRENKL